MTVIREKAPPSSCRQSAPGGVGGRLPLVTVVPPQPPSSPSSSSSLLPLLRLLLHHPQHQRQNVDT